MMQTDLHDHPPPDDHDPQAQRRIIVSHVRVNVTQKDGNKTLSIPSTMHKIMNSLRDVDNKVTFEDIQRKPFSLATFPSDKATFDNSFGTVIKEGRSTQVILGFTIKSCSTLGSLKQAIMPVLQRLGTYMRPHLSTTWERLDTITIGHCLTPCPPNLCRHRRSQNKNDPTTTPGHGRPYPRQPRIPRQRIRRIRT
jgi:hypothetical protein